MFKLIKILNSGVNVPETVKLTKPASLTVKAGTALVITNGIAAICGATEAPTHIAIQSPVADATSVFCHEVNGNMLFETTVSAAPTSLIVGDKVTLSQDTYGCTRSVTATTSSGVATITDLMGASEKGDKVTVRFC